MNKRYEIGDEVVIDLFEEAPGDDAVVKGPGLLVMTGEQKTPGAKPGDEDEYSHRVLDLISFTDSKNLELARKGLDLLDEALEKEFLLREG